jgi:hypothetical protein
MNKTLFFSVASFLLFSCKQGESNKKINTDLLPSLDTTQYHLDTFLYQNGYVFNFLQSKENNLPKEFQIVRSGNGKDTIVWDGTIKDGYRLEDMDNDGNTDFISSHRLYDLVYLFDTSNNSFADEPFCLPGDDRGIIDSIGNIRWGYKTAVYASPHDYSDLFTIKNKQPYFYYRIEYYAKAEQVPREYVTSIKLYKFRNGNFDSTVFLKEIKTINPSSFDYEAYWKLNHKKLVEDF